MRPWFSLAVSKLWFCQCADDIIVSWICRMHFLEKTRTKTSLTLTSR